jgi:hypothetical protein
VRARALSLTTGALSAVGVAAFLAFGQAADRAMSKHGVGDPLRHAELSNYAGASFYLAAAAWAVCIVSSQLAPKPYRGKALFWFGLMLPIATIVAWFIGATGA